MTGLASQALFNSRPLSALCGLDVVLFPLSRVGASHAWKEDADI